MILFHDSRDPAYRSPFGAGVCGQPAVLRLKAEPAPKSAQLRLWWDERAIVVGMAPCGDDLYEARFELPEHPGVLWYFFIVEDDERTVYYGNAADHMGGEGAMCCFEPAGYQITVYQRDYAPPAWMREGLIYQIMVDRFCAARPIAGRPPLESGHYHKDWREEPEINLPDPATGLIDYDFFGGDLRGVKARLPYLKELGVTALYLNPVFRALSNHKYDTGDYRQIDPSFGDEADFAALCEEAREAGIRVLIDGVFSHTGASSRYFNKFGRYDSVGAYQSEDSPYAAWYTFKRFPDEYDCWWGFKMLPNVREMNPKYLDFIIGGEDAVIAHWIRRGCSGWRLDVADELPMPFLRLLRERVKREDPEAAVLGEVWENASNKVSYGELRCYCTGDTLDSCMNYPLREALIDFLLGRADAARVKRRLDYLGECYPRPFFYALMNLLGSHDRPRAINVLAGVENLEPPYERRTPTVLPPEKYALGRARLIAAWRFLCAMPGMPGLYYGDEAGMTGMTDPYCRETYPWGGEDQELLAEIARANRERQGSALLKTGDWRLYAPTPDALVVARKIEGGKDAFGQSAPDGLTLRALNRASAGVSFTLPADGYLTEPIEMTCPPLAAEDANPSKK